jgi:hypothetical protein
MLYGYARAAGWSSVAAGAAFLERLADHVEVITN